MEKCFILLIIFLLNSCTLNITNKDENNIDTTIVEEFEDIDEHDGMCQCDECMDEEYDEIEDTINY